jgi:hypothetical protein
MERPLKYLVVLLLLLFASVAFPYDKEPGNFKEFDEEYVDLSTTIVDVVTAGHGTGIIQDEQGEWVERRGSFELRAVGFVMGRNFVVTAAHVITPKRVLIQTGKWNYWETSIINILSRTISIGDHTGGSVPAYVYYEDQQNDLAILRFHQAPCFTPLDYLIEWTQTFFFTPIGWIQYDSLEEGDAVAVIVRQRDEMGELGSWFEVRYGTVISTGVAGIPTEYLPYFVPGDFTTDIVLYPGDSGSPMFAFDGGEPIIVGIGRAATQVDDDTVYSYATRTDSLKRIIN